MIIMSGSHLQSGLINLISGQFQKADPVEYVTEYCSRYKEELWSDISVLFWICCRSL